MNGVGDWNSGEGSHWMAKTIQEMIDSLSHEEFQDLVDALPEDELEHWGVLGMKWGVRKDRRTGKRVGQPAKGTPRAKHTTPSVSPASARPKAKSKGNAKTTTSARKTANDEVSIEAVNADGKKSDKRVVAKLNQKQKSKLGEKGLDLDDLSVEQLRTAADRMRLEAEITKMLDGPTKDQAMQAVVNRIKLEQEYARLTAAPPTKREKFVAVSKEILKDVAKTQVKNALNAAAKSSVDNFLIQNGIIPPPKDKDKKGWSAPKNWKTPKEKDKSKVP